MTCCFFGHSDAPDVKKELEEKITELIEKENVNTFLVGNQGNFDVQVKYVLEKVSKKYPHIHYSIVLAYMPGKKQHNDMTDYTKTIFPDILEKIPPRFAISHRNKWVVNQSDIVVSYIRCSVGGAAQFVEYAKHRGKIIIDL